MFDVYASTDLSDRWTPVRGVAAGVHLALDPDDQAHGGSGQSLRADLGARKGSAYATEERWENGSSLWLHKNRVCCNLLMPILQGVEK